MVQTCLAKMMTIKQTLGEPLETLSVPDQVLGDQVPIISALERFGDRNGEQSTCIYIIQVYNGFPSASVSQLQYFPGQGVLEINSSDIFLKFSKNNCLGNYFKYIYIQCPLWNLQPCQNSPFAYLYIILENCNQDYIYMQFIK